MDKKTPVDFEFNRIMLYIFDEGKVTVTVGSFPVGADVSDGICFIEVDSDTIEDEIKLDYNFGSKKLVLKP